jgi:hypothetical protein
LLKGSTTSTCSSSAGRDHRDSVLQSAAGVALIDPGPSTTLDKLREALRRKGIAFADVRQLLLTHIHLDHAGAVGSLLRENPAIDVVVHERGAPHIIDPAKLLASASRLYGDDMERLWGDVLPVPADRVRALKGGERIVAGGRELLVEYRRTHRHQLLRPSSRTRSSATPQNMPRRRNPTCAHAAWTSTSTVADSEARIPGIGRFSSWAASGARALQQRWTAR